MLVVDGADEDILSGFELRRKQNQQISCPIPNPRQNDPHASFEPQTPIDLIVIIVIIYQCQEKIRWFSRELIGLLLLVY
jgi:hypothetical protein